jgi:hypothetical protein
MAIDYQPTLFNYPNFYLTMKNTKSLILCLSLFFVAITVLAQGTETRNLGSFTKIHSGGSWEVIISSGNKDEVRLVSNNISLDKVITEVKNNTLKISLEKGNYRNIGLTVYVTVREVEGIKSTGSGNVKLQPELSVESLDLSNTGSGNILIEKLNAENLTVDMTGSGYVTVGEGKVNSLEVSQTGSGSFKADGLSAEKARINQSGSGQSVIGEVESLNVKSTGSGNVYYSGKLGSVNISATGSAKVIKR